MCAMVMRARRRRSRRAWRMRRQGWPRSSDYVVGPLVLPRNRAGWRFGPVVGVHRPEDGIGLDAPVEPLDELVEERLAPDGVERTFWGLCGPGRVNTPRRGSAGGSARRRGGPRRRGTRRARTRAPTGCMRPAMPKPALGAGVHVEVVGDVPHVAVEVVAVEHLVEGGDGEPPEHVVEVVGPARCRASATRPWAWRESRSRPPSTSSSWYQGVILSAALRLVSSRSPVATTFERTGAPRGPRPPGA